MFSRLRELTIEHKNLYLSIHHTEPTDDEHALIDYDVKGVISKCYLQSVLPNRAMHYYLCGPMGFMKATYGYLQELGANEQNIYYEFFGMGEELGIQTAEKNLNQNDFTVSFTQSAITLNWDNTYPNLLDLAESAGLRLPFSCRMGTCSTCESMLQEGSIKYDPEPFVETEKGKILICCSQPVSDVKIKL